MATKLLLLVCVIATLTLARTAKGQRASTAPPKTPDSLDLAPELDEE